MHTASQEIKQGQRFEFGKNWQRFLRVLNEERIVEAEKSLRTMLEMDGLRGKSFLDIGSGSGLFSLAAMRLGAARVHSFDYDPACVACTQELKRRYFPEAKDWTIEEGSALDAAYLASLGQYDIVYSWGVLHHTGNMWQALENVVPVVALGGRLFIAIYNDQDGASLRWQKVKMLYNRGTVWRIVICGLLIPYFELKWMLIDLLRRKNPLARYRAYSQLRGMSLIHNWLDWLGGFPFQVAKPEGIFEFYRVRGFNLLKLKTCAGGYGNNEYVFQKVEG
jgi:2-polyprenyl-6-hydroxyphenyl methylase/3-demethylubiquinone-9 3-methyltransferase